MTQYVGRNNSDAVTCRQSDLDKGIAHQRFSIELTCNPDSILPHLPKRPLDAIVRASKPSALRVLLLPDIERNR